MNQTILSIVIVASLFLVALTLLFVAGLLIRTNLNRAAAANPRFAKRPAWFVRDLRALEDALVEFCARSNESARILSLLTKHRKPLGLATIAQEVRLEQVRSREEYVLPTSIAWAVLCVLQVPGLVRMNRHGFLITETGRQVHRRIVGDSAISAEGYATLDTARTGRTKATLAEGHQTIKPQVRCMAVAAPNAR